ncbi:hypothetical protein [Clostridium saudiense]|uniref:hypothetical protein n=1 Tax=Clostridium saudiense TaxID=1414720 RepID=UPI0026708779|nr:hypothetical protein [Clostridium saudiense]
MFNKDNVFITVNEEVSSIIQQYVIREIKKVLDKYKTANQEDIRKVERLIDSITNENIKEELLNDWDKALKLANEIGDNKANDVIISMYQWLKDNTSMTISIEDVIEYCERLNWQGYIVVNDDSIIYKKSSILEEIARELLDDMLEYEIHVDTLLDKDSLIEYWINSTSKEKVIDDLIYGNEIEELLGMNPVTIFTDDHEEYLYSEIDC